MGDTEKLKVLKAFYEKNADYRDFVDKNALTYNKSIEYVMSMPITEEYRQSLLVGGCNNRKQKEGGKE